MPQTCKALWQATSLSSHMCSNRSTVKKVAKKSWAGPMRETKKKLLAPKFGPAQFRLL